MITLVRIHNSLYYVSSNGEPDMDNWRNAFATNIKAMWLWCEAPQTVRQAFRNRSDFWAIAPQCIAREWLPNTRILNR